MSSDRSLSRQDDLPPRTEPGLDDGFEHRDYDDEDRHREYDESFPAPEGCDQW